MNASLDDAAAMEAHFTMPDADVTLTAIPYYAWANRGENQMRVWMPEE